MKVSILIIVIGIAGRACLAQMNFYYTSGRLFEDPVTSEEIHSPFLSCYANDEQRWIAYDPEVLEGRFVSVTSTYSTAVACGYVKGSLDFLGNKIITPSNDYTAIAISVKQNMEVEWFYAHNTGIVPSKFHWAQKLRDGMTLLSGHEYNGNKKTAILLRIDHSGAVTWSKRMDQEIGLEVHSTAKDRIFWMTTSHKNDEIAIYELNQLTGDIRNEIRLGGKTSGEGIRDSKSLYLSESDLSVARISSSNRPKILVDRFTLEGLPLASFQLPFSPENGTVLELQGITQRPNGHVQLALNLNGCIRFGDNEPIHTDNKKKILLTTLDKSGYLLGVENYGSQDAAINGIYRLKNRVAITGSHKGDLNIQSQKLSYDNQSVASQGYLVYLDDYDLMSRIEDLPVDPEVDIAELVIYPNPATKEHNVTILNNNITPEVAYEIRVYDNTARLQSQQLGRTELENSRDELNITRLASGLYHVFMIQDEKVTSRGKFIISR